MAAGMVAEEIAFGATRFGCAAQAFGQLRLFQERICFFSLFLQLALLGRFRWTQQAAISSRRSAADKILRRWTDIQRASSGET